MTSEEQPSIEELFKSLGMGDLPEERKVQFLAHIGQLLIRRVLIRIAERLDEPQQMELEELLDRDDQEEVFKFLRREIPDLEEIIREEMEFIREDILSITEGLKK